jgi:hypothetical protein
MTHPDALILADHDEARDPATQLFLEQHVRECAECRELRNKVERVDVLIAALERPIPVPPWSDLDKHRSRRHSAVLPIAVAVVVVGILAGTALREWRSVNDVAGTGAAAEQTTSFEIRPVAPWRTTGTGRATLSSRGELVLEVSVRGPASEISRPGTDPLQPNFIWHLVEGTCASWERNDPGHSVIARWTLDPQQPDAQDFRHVVSKGELDPMTRPHALAAFRNGGGGPLYACGDIASFGPPAAASSAATPAKASPALPPDWQVLTEHDLTIPLPQGWTKTLDAPASGDRPDPANDPRLLYFGGSTSDAAARFVAIWIWPSRSLDQLVRERYVQGNLSLISEGTAPSWRPMREVIGVASWSAGAAGGRYRARHLFVKVDPERVVDVVVFGPRVASTETEPTPDMRSIQEIIAGRIVAPSQQAGCPRTQSTDALTGVVTSNGVIGIVGETFASSGAFNDSFVMVKRAAAVGERVAVVFEQIPPITAPATSVSYGVPASPRTTPWGDVAFELGVKPIAFPSSCWRLLVDGADSGIVLFVGP